MNSDNTENEEVEVKVGGIMPNIRDLEIIKNDNNLQYTKNKNAHKNAPYLRYKFLYRRYASF